MRGVILEHVLFRICLLTATGYEPIGIASQLSVDPGISVHAETVRYVQNVLGLIPKLTYKTKLHGRLLELGLPEEESLSIAASSRHLGDLTPLISYLSSKRKLSLPQCVEHLKAFIADHSRYALRLGLKGEPDAIIFQMPKGASMAMRRYYRIGRLLRPQVRAEDVAIKALRDAGAQLGMPEAELSALILEHRPDVAKAMGSLAKPNQYVLRNLKGLTSKRARK
jgi:hypothetical protein